MTDCIFIRCKDGPLCIVHPDAEPECQPDNKQGGS